MDESTVFEVVKKQIKLVLDDVDISTITLDMSLKDLGANSLDRTEIAASSMEELELAFPVRELAAAQNLRGLVTIFCEKFS